MKKIIDVSVITLSIILIGFIMIFSIFPNIVLNSVVTVGGFAIPIFIVIVTMIVQVKKSEDAQEKDKIRKFWLKTLLIIYSLLLVTILFLNNEYRRGEFQNIGIFSREHFETSNFIPFATIIDYISRLISQNNNIKIVILNFSVNILLFTPMGFFIPILFNDKIRNIKQFTIMIFGITLVVETLQFITYRGSTDIDDIILNTIGAILIYILMKTKFMKKILKKIIDMEE